MSLISDSDVNSLIATQFFLFIRVVNVSSANPCEEEELGGDERIHITIGDEGHLHSLQKGLRGVFTPQEFAEIFEVAQEKCAELRKIVAEKEAN